MQGNFFRSCFTFEKTALLGFSLYFIIKHDTWKADLVGGLFMLLFDCAAQKRERNVCSCSYFLSVYLEESVRFFMFGPFS